MVWKFINQENTNGKAEFERITSQINSWWKSFEKELPNIEKFLTDEKCNWDIETFVETNLQVISPKIMWEVDGWGPGKYFFSLTAEGERYLHPLVQSIVAAAPKLQGWTVFDERLPSEFSELDEILKESCGIGVSQIMFKIEPREGNTLALVFAIHGTKSISEAASYQAAFLTSEMLLGEKIFDCWISSVTIEKVPAASPAKLKELAFRNLSELPNSVLESIDNSNKLLPNNAIFRRKDELARKDFSLEPEKADDYPERLDMMAASSIIPDIWKSAHSEVPFDSIRFSKHGEKFCYLKMEGEGTYANTPHSRDRLAKTLDERLIAAQLGCTTGGASGLRYSYIDLVLLDVEKAIPIIKEVMAYEHMPERSWLLFFDIEWSREWVGLFAQTPPPPLMPHPYSIDEAN